MGATTGVAALGAPRGPLFVPGFVSGCLSVQELQRSWHTLIAALELDSRAFEADDDAVDVTVEDLKVVTDAQLVDKALAEVLDGGNPKLGVSQSGSPLESGYGVAGGQSHACVLLEDDPRPASVAASSLAVVSGGGAVGGLPEDAVPAEVDEAAMRREEALVRMKQCRKTERGKANLHALRFKKEREAQTRATILRFGDGGSSRLRCIFLRRRPWTRIEWVSADKFIVIIVTLVF